MNLSFSELLQGLIKGFKAPLFNLGTQPISLFWIAEVALLLGAVFLAARLSKRILKRRLLTRFGISEGNQEVISTLLGITVGVLGGGLLLQAMGLNIESLAIVLGGVGVGVGFGLQELTKNLVSGITLLGERKLKVGDLIEFNGKMGFIQEIAIRSTVIRTLRGSELIVPNAELTNAQVENWSYTNGRGRVDIAVHVDAGYDPVWVTEILLEAAYLEASVLTEPAPKVLLQRFGEAGADFELLVWVDGIERGAAIKSALNFIIEYKLRRCGVRKPIEQLDAVAASHPPSEQGHKPSNTAKPVQSLRDRLIKLPYFAGFDELQIRPIIELGRRKQLVDGEILVNQGQREHSFCIVLTGAIAAIFENRKISQRVFVFNEGDYFGELPLVLNIPYPTTMRAIGETCLFMINAEGFHFLLKHYPYLQQQVTEELLKRQESIQLCQQSLREMDLLEEDEPENPVAWLRKRLQQVFRLNKNE